VTPCSVCRVPFTPPPQLPDAHVCSIRCAKRVPVIAGKREKERDKARREALKPRKKWLAETQTAFNAFIRKRDERLGCISCGTHNGKANAGHFLSVGARPELRFNERNCALQCERCNTYLHGNLIAYRVELIRRIGLWEVERLEGPHSALKPTVDELKALKAHYRARVKAMEAAQ